MASKGEGENGDAASCCDPPAIAAASGTAQDTPYCPEKKEANCCATTLCGVSKPELTRRTSAPGVAEASCCSEPIPKACGSVATSWNLADIDINEWAGELIRSYAPILLTSLGSYKIFAVKL